MKTAESLAKEIAAMVALKDHVSFAELAKKWPEHFHLKDGLCFDPEVLGEAIYWSGISENGFRGTQLRTP